MKQLLIFWLLFPVWLTAQTQIGESLYGATQRDEFGHSVSMSADGKRVAMGAYFSAGNGIVGGHARVYENTGGTWTQIGSDINGDGGDFLGRTVSLSADGTRVAIGAPRDGFEPMTPGRVEVYADSAGTWVQIGEDITGQAINDRFGRTMSMSSDGTRVAIGAFGSDENAQNSGLVQVYADSAGVWTQVGNTFYGEEASDGLGASVSLSGNGTRVAISAPGNEGDDNSAGQVQIFEDNGGTWNQIGINLAGEPEESTSGGSVSLSADGRRVAFRTNDNLGDGVFLTYVQIYEQVDGTWNQVGSDIVEEEVGSFFGDALSLSADGSRIAIGASYAGGGANVGSGQVRIYDEGDGAWIQVGENIDGEATNDRFGQSVSLSANGAQIAIGAPSAGVGGQVQIYELPLNFVNGTVFQDHNENGVQDAGEPGVNNYPVNTTGGSANQVFTKRNGSFSLPVNEGLDYSFHAGTSDCNPSFTTPASYALTYSPDSSYQLDFGLVWGDDSARLRALLNSGTIRCGFEHDFWLTVLNDGCQPLAGEGRILFPPEMTFIESDIAPLVLEDRLLVFAFDTLPPDASQVFRVRFRMPDENFAGQPISLGAAAGAMTGNGALVEADTFVYSEVLRCAIDPNDKQVFPARPEPTNSNYTQIDESLRYTVRFQNTGNDTAFTVRIEDQISASLNLETFKPLAASHPYGVTIREDRTVIFLFEDILLPDSTTDLTGSQGFVAFEIDAYSDLEDLPVVENTAGIFFDFNQPVITNTVRSTFVEFLDEDQDGFLFYEECDDTNRNINPTAEEIAGNGVDEDCDGEDGPVSIPSEIGQNVRFFPNPTTRNIHLHAPRGNTYTVIVLDAMGRRINATSLSDNDSVDFSEQPSGVYLLRLEDERNGKVGYRKVVVQR